MDKYDIHKDGDKWKFGREGSKRATKTADTKEEIIQKAREHMSDKTGSVKIRKENGQYQEERTYQRKDDPKKSPG